MSAAGTSGVPISASWRPDYRVSDNFVTADRPNTYRRLARRRPKRRYLRTVAPRTRVLVGAATCAPAGYCSRVFIVCNI
ncbi:hypothetical protein EVAR_46379_1 [Eumeta japonica]|uniref:Uncharacterized protein n=1 Tax=Eumeta variegata TaxID=151549 RepID=A0A4C1WWR4_EUMVA|nr:hypothetical protein EVAR_46379_1 [Eumeta japonica]